MLILLDLLLFYGVATLQGSLQLKGSLLHSPLEGDTFLALPASNNHLSLLLSCD